MSLSDHRELLGLLESLCEATITCQQRERLKTLVCDDPEAQRLYVEYMTFAADLKRTLWGTSDYLALWPNGLESYKEVPQTDQGLPVDADSGTHFAEQEVVDPAGKQPWEIAAQKEAVRTRAQTMFERFKADERRRQQDLARKQYLRERRKLFICVGSLAALLVLVASVWFCDLVSRLSNHSEIPPTPAPPPVVARITKSLNARWLQRGLSAEPGTVFRPSTMFLAEGLVELAFDGGTEVVVQAPADLRLENIDQVFLHGGKISARIVDGSSGFIVRTPTGTVVDYGTEFGVIVNDRGETEALVYEGKVGLRSGSDPVRSGASRMLKEGQAGTVDTMGEVVFKEFRPLQVIREIPEEPPFGIPGKRFDLADALVGGNGFGTADSNQRVSIETGMISTTRPNSVNPPIAGGVSASPPGLPFVDFLFVPDGDAGPTVVNSAGHQFEDCPDTDGLGYSYIMSGGLLRHKPGVIEEQILGGRRFGTCSQPVISMHANAGITFDLQAVGDSVHGARVDRFTALCGIAQAAAIAKRQETGGTVQNHADFWVLVDGQVRFEQRGVQISSGAVPVEVELSNGGRFLTLVVTDGGDGHGFDWAAFALPALELSQNERADGQLGE